MTEETAAATVRVASRSGEYPVTVGSGIIRSVVDVVRASTGAERVAVISDENVAPLHGVTVAGLCTAAGLDVTHLTFPAGEASKTRKTWSILSDAMLEAGLGRDCCIVAVGGGVTTDLGGFVAATYLRGVPVVQVPTSYLAMIDASVGGKTGVDVRAGKNLVGAFHAPVAVIADTELLATLPVLERAQGLVEAFKHGAILDEAHFEALDRDRDALLAVDARVAPGAVTRSIQIKGEVVGRDEFESDYRQILNFGHTIGHAIEAASDYTLGHGNAVALGMLAEADIGEAVGVTQQGTRERLDASLRPLLGEIDVEVRPADAGAYLSSDKKARRGRPRFVLLERLGRTAQGEGWTHSVPGDLVDAALARVLAAS